MKHKDIKYEEAQNRQEKRNKITPEEQLSLLDQKFGKNTGAVRERTRLNKLIKDGK